MDVITAEGDRATMTIFAISNDNYISVLDAIEDAQSNPETQHFSSLKQLGKLAAEWPASRLLEIWSNLPGAMPVKKFTDRKTAVIRIWKQIGDTMAASPTAAPAHDAEESESANAAGATQEPSVAQQATEVAAAGEEGTDETSRPKRRHSGAPKAQGPREGRKTVRVLELLKRPGGATSAELMAATGWQAHSVRGFLSGTIGKKMGLALLSAKREETRAYSLPA